MMPEYIDKEDAYLAVLEHWDGDMLPGDFDDIIRAVPSADVAPVVHGRWIDDDCAFMRCSLCGYENDWEWATPYCPNCGARMDGGESND